MTSVGVNPPKTPVSEDSLDTAAATLPNVCKMPGPPAPFVPTPLPNVGRSADRLDDATTTVKIEGKKIAIKGSSYKSQPSPDVASQGTGGGVVSSTTEGKTKFVAPGSMNVQAEGQNIQLLGDAMTNNGGGSDNSGTLPGNNQPPSTPAQMELNVDCDKKQKQTKHRWGPCEVEQLCAMLKAYNESPHPKVKPERTPSKPASKFSGLSKAEQAAQNRAFGAYTDSLGDFSDNFDALVEEKGKDHEDVAKQFHSKCLHDKWAGDPPEGMGAPTPMPRSKANAMSPDHMHPVGLGGPLPGSLKWADSNVNSTVGKAMDKHNPETHPGGVKAHSSCNCTA
ncbi:PAAR-like domain-containing protein [Caballeronia sp. LZ019]|uniref:PAAR-like domain-containing protein n=1 Tax=Caballeronia sp. LZ019 TaxID=3038555 RepID=UPI0028668174|nr:PAAR-like domain-containing protein [Caballeronia sp. LZ019]MDR5807029.1 DUF4150 domain-containing protein [Caballeronia sp. LZ019]